MSNSIKEYLFSQTIINATTPTAIETAHPIKGELVSIHWKTNATGSLSLGISGLGDEVWRRNAPSGTTWQTTYPRFFTESTTGSIANAEHTQFVLNDPLILTFTGMTSGTGVTTDVRFRYY